MTTNGGPVLVFSMAGMLAASPMGINVETMLIGTCFTLFGVFGRIGFEIARGADTPGGVKWGSIAAQFGGGLLSAVAITVLYLSLLRTVGIQSDTASVIGLIFFGFTGPKALLWLLNTATGAVNKRTGLNIPQFGADEARKP